MSTCVEEGTRSLPSPSPCLLAELFDLQFDGLLLLLHGGELVDEVLLDFLRGLLLEELVARLRLGEGDVGGELGELGAELLELQLGVDDVLQVADDGDVVVDAGGDAAGEGRRLPRELEALRVAQELDGLEVLLVDGVELLVGADDGDGGLLALLLDLGDVRGVGAADLAHGLADELHGVLQRGVVPRGGGRDVGVLGDHDGRLLVAALGEVLPQLLGDERHERVEQAETHVEAQAEGLARRLLRLLVGAEEDGLDRLEVHVAELVEPEVVDRGGGARELVLCHVLLRGPDGVGELGEDPAVDVLEPELADLLLPERDEARGLELHQAEAGGVPDLVAEVAVPDDAVDVEVDVPALRRVRAEREAQRVGAALGDAVRVVLPLPLGGGLDLLLREVAVEQLLVEPLQGDALDHVDRVDDVAERLAHLAPLRVPDHGVQVDLVERELAGELEREHDHPGDPEEEDVVPRLEQGGREVPPEVLRALVRPPEDGERVDAGREPRVQHVGVALERDVLGRDLEALARQLQRRRLGARDHPAAVLRRVHLGAPLDADEVGRDAVPPPQLAGDAPVADGLEPAVPDLLLGLREELELAGARLLDGLLGHALAVDVPLGDEAGLDDVAGARAEADVHRVLLHLLEEALLLQRLADGDSGVEARHARELAEPRGDLAVLGEDGDERELVPHAAGVVVRVVGGRDLDAAGAEGHVDELLVADDRDASAVERVDDVLAVQVGVALVVGVDRDGGVAEHGLQTGGLAVDLLAGALDLVGEGDDLAEAVLTGVPRDAELDRLLEVLVVDLDVGDGGAQGAAPVDQLVLAVDEPLLVQSAERLGDGDGQALVHRERLAVPVERRAESAELVLDRLAVLLLPLPHLGDEVLAPEVVARLALLALELLLDDDLRRDAGVVGRRHPQRLAAVHAVPARDRVLDGVRQGVAEVQLPGDVGRRDDHHELLRVRVARADVLGLEEVALPPPVVPRTLHTLRVVGRVQLALDDCTRRTKKNR